MLIPSLVKNLERLRLFCLITMLHTDGKQVNDHSREHYVAFPHLDTYAKTEDGNLVLNRHSTFITRDHDFPPAKVSNVPPKQSRQSGPGRAHTSEQAKTHLKAGHAIRRRGCRREDNANQSARRHLFSCVGGKSLQVSVCWDDRTSSRLPCTKPSLSSMHRKPQCQAHV